MQHIDSIAHYGIYPPPTVGGVSQQTSRGGYGTGKQRGGGSRAGGSGGSFSNSRTPPQENVSPAALLLVTNAQMALQECPQAAAMLFANRYKTKLCRQYSEDPVTGEPTCSCPYKKKCMFAHARDELRTMEMNLRDGITTKESIRSFLKKCKALKTLEEQKQRLVEQQEVEKEKQKSVGPEEGGTSGDLTTTAAPPAAASPSTVVVEEEGGDEEDGGNNEDDEEDDDWQQQELIELLKRTGTGTSFTPTPTFTSATTSDSSYTNTTVASNSPLPFSSPGSSVVDSLMQDAMRQCPYCISPSCNIIPISTPAHVPPMTSDEDAKGFYTNSPYARRGWRYNHECSCLQCVEAKEDNEREIN